MHRAARSGLASWPRQPHRSNGNDAVDELHSAPPGFLPCGSGPRLRLRRWARDARGRPARTVATSSSMFQNTGAGATIMPLDVGAQRGRLVPLAEMDVGRMVDPVLLQVARRSPSAWPDRSPWRTASRSFSIVSSHGQPNIALSHEALKKPAITGLRMSAGDPRGQEGVPAALVRRILLGAARHQGLPVHRLHVDLEAGLLELRLGDRREVGQHLQVGRLQQHDRRAVVARLLQQLLGLGDVGVQHVRPCPRRWRAACRRRTSPCRPCSTRDRRSWP